MPTSPATLPSVPPRPVLGVSVSVWRGDQVLLVRRGKAPSEGLWAPVGGRVEWGETLEAAALREVREETGVTCEIVGFTQLREMISVDGDVPYHVVLAVFAARWISGAAVAGDDAEAVAWVDFHTLSDDGLVEGVIPYIAATRDLIV
jgi:8-oxo-dGTP diphosphatase